MNKMLAVATILTLEKIDNLIIAAAYNGLTGFGRISKGNMAYQPLKELSLIREDGQAHDNESLLAALDYEINRRVEAGTFV